MKQKPTDRELNLLLREVTGRMPSMPHNTGEVRIVRTAYKDADRFELHWRDPANKRRKAQYHNWRHAVAAAKWVNTQLEAAKGQGNVTFAEAADVWLKAQEARVRSKTPDLSPGAFGNRKLFARQLCERFGGTPLDKFHVGALEDWLLEKSAHNKRATLQAKACVAFWILEHARKRQMVQVNPLKGEKLHYPGAGRPVQVDRHPRPFRHGPAARVPDRRARPARASTLQVQQVQMVIDAGGRGARRDLWHADQ